jgi:mRNA-degrading endonuclease RelE of RelBE toxin-antitoxin system
VATQLENHEKYIVVLTDDAAADIKKLEEDGKSVPGEIYTWILFHLENCSDPTKLNTTTNPKVVKKLKGNKKDKKKDLSAFYRFKPDKRYRLIADIRDGTIRIVRIVMADKRRVIYERAENSQKIRNLSNSIKDPGQFNKGLLPASFKLAVDHKNVSLIRATMIRAIKEDPSFLLFIEMARVSKQISELYAEHDYSLRINSSVKKWDVKYYKEVLVSLEENFSFKRILHAQQVAREVYGNKIATSKLLPKQQ